MNFCITTHSGKSCGYQFSKDTERKFRLEFIWGAQTERRAPGKCWVLPSKKLKSVFCDAERSWTKHTLRTQEKTNEWRRHGPGPSHSGRLAGGRLSGGMGKI